MSTPPLLYWHHCITSSTSQQGRMVEEEEYSPEFCGWLDWEWHHHRFTKQKKKHTICTLQAVYYKNCHHRPRLLVLHVQWCQCSLSRRWWERRFAPLWKPTRWKMWTILLPLVQLLLRSKNHLRHFHSSPTTVTTTQNQVVVL